MTGKTDGWSPLKRRARVAAAALFGIAVLAALAAGAWPVVASGALAASASSRAEAALLREDWQGVVEALGPDDALSPTNRLLKGHACLALNRDDDALTLFAGAASPESLEQWRAWTGELVGRYPRQAIAHYLAGDALARLGQLDGAQAEFGAALALAPRHALTLNARGVVRAARGQWDGALVDLTDATQSGPALADAFASRGVLYIQRKTGAEGALRAFDRALQLSPDSVLALNGRASARLALGDWEGAQADLEKALARSAEGTPAGEVVRRNLASIAASMGADGASADSVADASGQQVGTRIDAQWSALKDKPSQSNVNAFVSTLRTQPIEVQNHYAAQIQDYARQRPEWGRQLSVGLNTVTGWNAPTGPAERLSGLIPSQASFEVGTAKGSVKGSVGGLTVQQSQLGVTRGNYNVATRLNSSLGITSLMSNTAPGGVTTSLRGAHLDEGEWPFVTHFGLLYPEVGR